MRPLRAPRELSGLCNSSPMNHRRSSAPPARTTAPTPARCASPSRTAARSRCRAIPTIRRRTARCARRSRATPSAPTTPERVLHPLRRVGPKGSGRFERVELGRGARRHRRAPGGDRRARPARRSCRTATPARWACCRARAWRRASSTGSARRCSTARSARSAGGEALAATYGAQGRHARRALRREPADRDLGQQLDRLEPALLDLRAGRQARRRQADLHRPAPHRDRREVPPAHRAAARHRRRARARR